MRAKLACSCSICHHTWPISKMVSQNTSIDWSSALTSVPVLTEKHYESLLCRRNIKMCIRSQGRYLSLCLPRDLLERLGVPRKWFAVSLGETPVDFTEIAGNEMSESFCKLAFLTLIKASNSYLPPSGNGFNSEVIGVDSLYKRDTVMMP